MGSTLAPAPTAAGARSRLPIANANLGWALVRRCFANLKEGSHLPVRKQAPTPSPSPPPPPPRSLPIRPKSSETLAKRREARQARSRPCAKSNSSANSSECQSSPSRSSPDALVKTKDRLPAASAACEQPMAPGEKHVSFGEVTIMEHPRWIDQDEHVHFPAPREPVPGGPMPASLPAHYASEWPSWALRTSPQLDIHLARPCDDPHCAWNSVAKFRRHFPYDSTAELFRSWSSIAKLGLR